MKDLPSYEAIQSAPRFSQENTGEHAKSGDLLRLSVADLVFTLELKQRVDWMGGECRVVFIDRSACEAVIQFTALPAGASAMGEAFGRAKYERVQALLRDMCLLVDILTADPSMLIPQAEARLEDWCDRARKEMP